jgi:hypothetical protein
MSAQPEYGAFTLTSNSSLTINPDLPSGNYSVFVKARSGPDSTDLIYTLNSISRTLAISHDTDAYSWHSLGHYNLTSTSLTIRSGGRNEIETVAFVPDPELENAEIKAAHYFINRSVVVMYEPEIFNQTYARHTFGTSRGYLELPEQTYISFSLSIPKETDYSEYIRIRTYSQSSAIITIDAVPYTVQLFPSDDFNWIPVTNMTLSRGLHTFSLQSMKALDFDTLILKSTDYQYEPPNVTVTYNQTPGITGTDPTRFSLTSNSGEPYFLVFNENYHPAWELTNSSGYEFDHFQINYYANGYYVNTTGNTTLNLGFAYQPPYIISVIVSQAGLFVMILLIAIGFWYKKKNRHNHCR